MGSSRWQIYTAVRGSTFPRSLFEFTSTSGSIWALHGASLVVLALFTAGAFTRITSILSLVAVLSYIHRAPAVASQAEPILVMLLLYLCVGPCGAKLSVDCCLDRKRAAGRTRHDAAVNGGYSPSWLATVSTRLIQLHLTIAYAAMALAKLNDGFPLANSDGTYHAWGMGEAAWWLAARPTSPLVDVTGLLTNNVLLVNIWTHAIVLFEVGFAVFIWRPGFRRCLLWAAVPMWLSLALITGLTPFCLTMLIGNLAFVDPAATKRCVGRFAD